MPPSKAREKTSQVEPLSGLALQPEPKLGRTSKTVKTLSILIICLIAATTDGADPSPQVEQATPPFNSSRNPSKPLRAAQGWGRPGALWRDL